MNNCVVCRFIQEVERNSQSIHPPVRFFLRELARKYEFWIHVGPNLQLACNLNSGFRSFVHFSTFFCALALCWRFAANGKSRARNSNTFRQQFP